MRYPQFSRAVDFAVRAGLGFTAVSGLALVVLASTAQAQYPGGQFPMRVPMQRGRPNPIQNGAPAPSEYDAFRAAVSQTPAQAQATALQSFLAAYPESSLVPQAQHWLQMAQNRAAADAARAGAAPPASIAPPQPAQPVTLASSIPPPQRITSGPPQVPAKPAIIQIDSHSLTIRADNSSLSQILRQVASSTGMVLDGLSRDERIYGSYGPGEPRDVLASLLEGSHYNIFMAGESARGVPRQLSLSPRAQEGAAQPVTTEQQNNGDQDADAGSDDQPPPPENDAPTGERGFAPGQQPDPPSQKTAQQIVEELQRMRQRNESQAPDPPQ